MSLPVITDMMNLSICQSRGERCDDFAILTRNAIQRGSQKPRRQTLTLSVFPQIKISIIIYSKMLLKL